MYIVEILYTVKLVFNIYFMIIELVLIFNPIYCVTIFPLFFSAPELSLIKALHS